MIIINNKKFLYEGNGPLIVGQQSAIAQNTENMKNEDAIER